MTVHIPSALRSYTQKNDVEVQGQTLAEILSTLDQRYPGLRFRIVTEQDTIRPHIRIFVKGKQAPHLAVPIGPDDHIYIVCALSGG